MRTPPPHQAEKPAEDDKLHQLRTRFEAEVAAGFRSGEGREWRAEDWNRLLRGEFRHPPSADSWATPPGWKDPRLQHDQ
jgi:hypothetical protein